MSGAQSREQLNPGHFEKLLKGPHDQELLDSIKTGDLTICALLLFF